MLFDILYWVLIVILVLALVVLTGVSYKHFKNMRAVRSYVEQDAVYPVPGWDNFFIGNVPIFVGAEKLIKEARANPNEKEPYVPIMQLAMD